MEILRRGTVQQNGGSIESNGEPDRGPYFSSGQAAVPWLILAIVFAYALFRYVVFGGTRAAQIPLFITNKALAAGSVVFLSMTGYACLRRRKAASKRWGRWALHTAAVHAVISVAILANETYPAFFGGESLSLRGELSLLTGILALYCFATIGKLSAPFQRRRALTACVLIAGHLLFFGFPGWLDATSWPRGFPPISLFAFGVTLTALAAYLKSYMQDG